MATVYELPLQLPWGEIPRYPHVEITPKVHTHVRVLPWFTTGFL